MDQGIAIVIGAFIGAAISVGIAYFTSKYNLRAVDRAANSAIESQSKALVADLKRTGLEIKAKIGIEVLSKNRQEWINDLRKQIALFVSQVDSSIVDIPRKHTFIGMEILKRQGKADNEKYKLDLDGSKEFISFSQDITSNLNCLQTNVELMLNPNEENNKKVINLMIDINNSISDLYFGFLPDNLQPKDLGKELTPEKINRSIQNNNTELKNEVTKILKIEWERVKKGE